MWTRSQSHAPACLNQTVQGPSCPCNLPDNDPYMHRRHRCAGATETSRWSIACRADAGHRRRACSMQGLGSSRGVMQACNTNSSHMSKHVSFIYMYSYLTFTRHS